MPRTRSSLGRKRQNLSKTYLTEKIGKRVKKLKKQGLLGRYSSKKLLSLFKTENIKIKKGKIKIDWKKIKPIKEKKILKVFKDFFKSPEATDEGIRKKREETREKLKDSLSGLADERLSDDDIDDFYELVKDDDFRYLADKIGDSDVYVIFAKAREVPSEEKADFIKTRLEDFIQITNSSDAYDKALGLYNKYFK